MRTIEENTIESYKNHLYNEEKSVKTIEKYIRDLRTFSTWLQQQEDKDITKKSVIEYKKYLDENYKPASSNSMLAALNVFFAYMEWHDCHVKGFKVQKTHIYAQEKEMTREEYKKLIDTAKQEGKLRLALIIETIGGTGIRISELKSITVEAVKNSKVVLSGKGKYREICLVKKLKNKLMCYCRQNGITQGSVFVTKNGNPLDRSNIWKEMQVVGERAGVDLEKVFPHNLRHFFARTYYMLHKNIGYLADILGHSNINTTRIYTATTEKNHREMLERLELVN